jgi:peptidoglycan/LPS O-acetylase OafA/YrhL
LSTAAPRGYLPTLDGWRAIAILGVMVTHGTDALLAPGAPFADPHWYTFTRYGAKGVELFFGISGFLICSRLLEEHEWRGGISLKGFYIRRFLRILPPYAVYLVVVGALAALGSIALAPGEMLHSALFLRNYWPASPPTGWFTAHLWSLAVEEHFYLLWPGLLVLFVPERAIGKAIALALLIAAWRFAVFHWPSIDPVNPIVSRFERTDLRLDALLWGCVIALVYRRPVWRERLARLLTTPAWAVVVGVLIIDIVLPPPFALVWQAILIPLVLLGTVLHPGGSAGRLLETKPMRWVGRISYSLYLWQSLFLVAFGVARPFGIAQQLPLSLALVFAFAAASYYWVERPMIRLGHRLAPPTTEGRI